MENKSIQILAQSGLSILPDNDRYTNRVEIRSETSNRLYVIAKNKKTSVWSCSCPGWIIHRKCKHLSALSSVLKQIDAKEVNHPKLFSQI
jgi:hypothetical protein